MKRYLQKKLSPSMYVALAILIVLGVSILFASINYLSDDFGLWSHRDAVRIWDLEKTSKYLLAHRYVPENFDGIMIGPSVSDNLDTKKIEGLRIYNLSMAGGNITEVAEAANEYIRRARNPRLLILCLHPYLTINSGKKGFQIHEKEYYGSLFSVMPAIIWARKIQHALGLMHGAYDDSDWGMHEYNKRYVAKGIDSLIESANRDRKRVTEDGFIPGREPSRIIDQDAYVQLEHLLNAARSRGIRIFAFYYPINAWKQEIMELTGEWAYYKERMDALFRPGEDVVDFNTEKYNSIRRNREAYLDTHLSDVGRDMFIAALERELESHVAVSEAESPYNMLFSEYED